MIMWIVMTVKRRRKLPQKEKAVVGESSSWRCRTPSADQTLME
jgi:hypothetical protein